MSSNVFARGTDLPRAKSAQGCVIVDEDGKRYLDGSGGAIVVGIGHGVEEVVDQIAAQARRLSYVHGQAFTTGVLEDYAAALAPLLPLPDARIYPVSGGSEAIETALKMARAYHLAHGEDRHLMIGRIGSYHGNTRAALDVGDRGSLRTPYLPWLGPAAHTGTPYEYRCTFEEHPVGCGARHAQQLEELILRLGPQQVAAFVAEPISGAALGACVPPEDYWPAVMEVCRRHGVLVIADEVMTGFGRTGTWFASESVGLEPDLMVAAKGAASGYWPLGLAIASGPVFEVIATQGLTHGFTYSHHPVGAAAGHAVLRYLQTHDLVAASAQRGAELDAALRELLSDHPHVGDIRGRGLLQAVEIVTDRETKAPFPRSEQVTEKIVAAAKSAGALIYSGTGCADGTNGDLVLLGPPLVITSEQVQELAQITAAAVQGVLGR